ncbi:TBC1 domain family member 22B [Uranotaenia lowii]|uniref:TBC1 domain family member 22B n=1 Tax=Uranotaenia lowii TaxID=190385 RepID=UPI002479E488|nr:TBC1 domain family member 22B [Uranotaenia lowii]
MMSNSSSGDAGSSFWKNNSGRIPGRPTVAGLNRMGPGGSQRVGGSGVGVGGPSAGSATTSGSFQDYQDSVSDAWDLGDDEFCIISGAMETPRISKKVSQSAAMNVIKTHRSTGIGGGVGMGLRGGLTAKTNTTLSSSLSSGTASVVVEGFDDLKIGSGHNLTEGGETLTAEPAAGNPQGQNNEGLNNTVSDNRLRQRFHAYPGRPQLLKLSSNVASKDVECESKYEKFTNILDAPLLNLIALKELSWSGIPRKMRAVTWRLLSGYLPTSLERRNTVLERKRVDYRKLVQQYFLADSRDENQQDTYRQIHIDVPRMNPHVPLFQQKLVQEMFERILFIWAIRHPASGYVQGINDLVTPFFIVFLQESIGADKDLEQCQLADLSQEQRDIIEADSFWCLSKFLDCIQDNYIFAQLGIQEKVNQLKELIQRIDGTLHRHLQTHGVDYLQFSFRWMNNLLTRELPLYCTIRLWDTYLAESDGFAVFQLYVCAAFLLHWREQLLQERDFQGLMLLLQNLPTHSWMDSHIGILVAEAFRLKFTYADTPKHLEGKS